jgi:mannitol/fructose-specific phosphotransferase system IIA component (Ntr-type)
MAVVMTISAMPIASRVLHDLKLLKTDLGFLTMSALAVNDIIGWALFTIILGLFTQSVFNIGSTVFVLAVTVGFSVLALTAGRYFSNKSIDFFHRRQLPEPSTSFTFACLVGIFFGAVTQKIGIHALFGFFIAGVVVGEAKNLKEETRSIISKMVHALFVPVFFVNIGLKIDFIAGFDLFLVSIITLVGIFGRFLGAWFGVGISKIPKKNKLLIAIAHTPGGMMEIVVALMALELDLITPAIFIAIVCSAVFSSIVMGPWMSYALKRMRQVTLKDYLDFKHGLVQINEEDKTDIIKKLCAKAAVLMPGISKDDICSELLTRETDFSTAIGEGTAIPHVRSKNIKKPLLIAGYSKKGIDWDSPDGKPVQFVFFLLSPFSENDLHIEILSKIAKVIQTKDHQSLLSACEDVKDFARTLKAVCG